MRLPRGQKAGMTGSAGHSSTPWRPDSWRDHEARQLPVYGDAERLAAVEQELVSYPPLVFAGEARKLETQLADVAAGKAFLLQEGDRGEALPETRKSQRRNAGHKSESH